ncbi:Noggin isoform 1 [Schistosoma japonicum]|uniref:Noggin isoform 1 n=1 Tax=Schistosoma japonicum TaxID=6182 RepID=A0A4Z2DS16_SCHJA|nr:Noggin isoform 1 [Schistosoma japonicum]
MSIVLNHLSSIPIIFLPPFILVLISILLPNSLQQLNEVNNQRYLNNPQKFAIITTGGSHKPYYSQRLTKDSYDADYSRKVNVKVSDILTRQAAAAASSQSPSSHASIKNSAHKVNNPMNGEPEIHDQSLRSNLESRPGGIPLNSDHFAANQRAQIVVKPSGNIDKNSLLLPYKVSQHSIVNEDRSWPPEHSHEFERVDVRVLGERIDSKALLQLRPSSTAASIRKLRRILGTDLQNEWMSIETPLNSQSSSSKSTRSTLSPNIPKPDSHLLNAVEELNFTVFRPVTDDGLIYPIKMTIDQVNIMKTWLLQRATCAIEYIWEDLGPLFWPRWIRRGVCVNTHSCSWPPGMRCRSSGSRALKLLRWVCKNDSDKESSNRRRREFQTNSLGRLSRDVNTYQTFMEERRSKRVRRLIRKLSLTANGYHCEWNRYEYMVNDHCTCGCEQSVINSN